FPFFLTLHLVFWSQSKVSRPLPCLQSFLVPLISQIFTLPTRATASSEPQPVKPPTPIASCAWKDERYLKFFVGFLTATMTDLCFFFWYFLFIAEVLPPPARLAAAELAAAVSASASSATAAIAASPSRRMYEKP